MISLTLTNFRFFFLVDVKLTMNFNENLMEVVRTEMLELWEQGQLCDITLVVEDGSIQAHKVFLAANSPYFKAMFCGSFADADKKTIDMKGKIIFACRKVGKFMMFLHAKQAGPPRFPPMDYPPGCK